MSSATITHRPAGYFTVDAGGQRRRIPWRQIHEIGSAAFWIDQTTRSQLPTRHALGNGLREEFTACILGGFGITGVMTLAAFHAVRDAGLLADGVEPTAVDLEEVLRTPLSVPGHTRPIRYRFARQRAHRVHLLRLVQTLLGLPSRLLHRELGGDPCVHALTGERVDLALLRARRWDEDRQLDRTQHVQ